MSAVPPDKQNSRANDRGAEMGRDHNRRRRRIFAALDLGTNNCRLLIAQRSRGGFKVVDGFSRIVGLGQGISEGGNLSETAIERTIDALKVCARKIKRWRVSNVRCVVTQAARSASNSVSLLERVFEQTGLQIEIISPQEEAELTFTGCVPLLDPAFRNALLFDVGGGSAEFVWARMFGPKLVDIEGWMSLPCGVVTLIERHGSHEFSRQEYRDLVLEVMDMLRPFDARFRIARKVSVGSVQMVGTAGAVTTIAGINMRLPRYNRDRVDGSWLSFEAIQRVSHLLSAQTAENRMLNPCIGRNRADLIVAGCAVLEAVCQVWPAGRLCVADRGVREGILAMMSGQPKASCQNATVLTAE